MPDGYACVRVDSRGAGRSPGYLDVWSAREAQDLYECVEWAGTQAWSNGKVGINGISYYAMNQWNVGALKPPHLAALCIWEGSSDYYRELCRHGGILCDFSEQLASAPGGERAARRRRARRQERGHRRAGRRTRDAARRTNWRSICADTPGEAQAPSACATITTPRAPPNSRRSRRRCCRPPIGAAWACTRAAISRAGSRAGSKQKWLEVHGDTHFTHFYSELRRGAAEALLRPFPQGRGHRLGASSRACRSTSAIPARNSCCAPRTNGRSRARNGPNIYLQPDGLGLEPRRAQGRDDADATRRPATASPSARRRLTKALEITGPVAAKLWVSSETTDADLFLVLRLFDPAGKEVTFIGSNDPRMPVGLGWLRASHRKLDPEKVAAVPALAHARRGMAADARRAGRARHRDLADLDRGAARLSARAHRARQGLRSRRHATRRCRNAPYPMKGVGPFLHIDPDDRPAAIFACRNTLHFARRQGSHTSCCRSFPRGKLSQKHKTGRRRS